MTVAKTKAARTKAKGGKGGTAKAKPGKPGKAGTESAATTGTAAKGAKGTEGGGGRLDRDRRARLVVLTLVLIAVTVAAAGVTLTTRLYAPQRYDEQAAQEALRVAPGYVEQVISYDYRTLEKDVRDARKNLTGKFLGEYDRSMSKVTPTLVSRQAIQEAKAAKAGVQEATADEVSVLVFSQRMTTKLDSKDPQVYQDRILVTLTKVGDRWLISQMRYLV